MMPCPTFAPLGNEGASGRDKSLSRKGVGGLW